MSELEKYRKKTCIEVVEETPIGDRLVQNEGNPNDRWWIDKETFESSYLPAEEIPTIEEMGGMTIEQMIEAGGVFDFGTAVSFLKQGYKVGRAGWNGKGMYVFLIGVSGHNDYWTYTNGKNDNYPLLPFIAMKTADDKVVPWLASQTDIIVEDWAILE